MLSLTVVHLREATEELLLPLGSPQIGPSIQQAGYQHRPLLLLLAGFLIRIL